ncbi:MAG TPA: discoidin domain-containing protein [Terriglobia bacterium]|nr:discoidin domain-containing protein [Terriglobia bacterium]
MIIGSLKRISPGKFLFAAAAVTLGFVLVSSGTLFQVTAQPAPQSATVDQGATVHVDVTPEHILNTIYPDTATGAWMDDLSKNQVDNLSKPETIQGIKNLGWGSITMRNNSELRLSAWHWNENGKWSDPASKSGYYAGSAELGEPVHYGYSYSLPHRDFMTSGDSPLVEGPQSYWKSNPYLTSHFTGERDALHPQWVVIDMGITRAVDAIHIQWVNPFAVVYVVQYWIGDSNALDWDMGPNGVWRAFPSGTVTNSTGGDVHLRLCDKPISARFVRVLMSKSSGTCDTHGAQDIRNCVGYALQTLSMGTIDAAGNYTIVYPANGVEPGPSMGRPHREGGGGVGGAFPGSAEDTAGSFCASSIDPWHAADNLITGGHDEYNGMDNFFTSGLTMGHPALVACAAIYDTPEDCANEVAYIHKRGYPVVGIEIGEECDGKHTMPEDYGAIYCQWATAIHKLTPGAKLGGPVFEGVDKDITLWADDLGRTSWLTRFIDYLKAHGHLQDLSFMSFEHYPFLVNGFSPPNDWDSLYLEPGIMKHVLHMWREDGVPKGVPLIISESGITAGGGRRGYMGATGRAIWECDAFGTFFEQGGTAFYRPAINNGAGDRWNYGGGPNGGGGYGTPEYTPFTSAHIINFEWLEHGGGANQIFPASADLMDAAGRAVITSYAVHRPDGNWSLMLINHDLSAAHQIHLVIDDAKRVQHHFAGPVALVQYCNTPSENKNTTMTPNPDGMYSLPIGSITVIRGKLR